MVCDGLSDFTKTYRCPTRLPVCVFWDGRGWSSRGCQTTAYSGSVGGNGTTSCACSHLSHFSLLDSTATGMVTTFQAFQQLDPPDILTDPKNLGILVTSKQEAVDLPGSSS